MIDQEHLEFKEIPIIVWLIERESKILGEGVFGKVF